jgi:hypothetical protein
MKASELLQKHRPSPEQARETLAVIETTAQSAEAEAEAAEAALADSLLAVAEGLLDSADIKKARQGAEAARLAANDSMAALAVARKRVQDAEAEAAGGAKSAKWATVLDLAAKRAEAAGDIERLADQLGKAYASLIQTTHEIVAALPARVDESALLHDPVIASAVRETMALHGCTAGMPALPMSLWELQRRPTLSDRVTAGNEVLRRAAK